MIHSFGILFLFYLMSRSLHVGQKFMREKLETTDTRGSLWMDARDPIAWNTTQKISNAPVHSP